MTIFAVFGFLVISIALWALIPRATTAVLVFIVFRNFYPWFLSLGDMNHDFANILGCIAMGVGIFGGFALDYFFHRETWIKWLR